MENQKKVRELDFHNRRYSSDNSDRSSQKKFYETVEYSVEVFKNKVISSGVNKNILEYGCGEKSIVLSQFDGYKTYIGIDISDIAISKISHEHRNCINAKFVVMPCDEISFNEKEFDLVFGSGILHHLDLRTAYEQISKAMSSSGKAIFYEPLGHNSFINLYRILTPGSRSVDEHPLLVDDLKLAENYFENVNSSYYGLFSILLAMAPCMRNHKSIVGFFNKLDDFVERFFPRMRKYFWIVIVEFERPKRSKINS